MPKKVRDESAEDAVIGCILFDPREFDVIKEVLKPDDFNVMMNRAIYREFCNAAQDKKEIDRVILGPILKSKGIIKDDRELDVLAQKMCLPGMIERYAAVVKEDSACRKLWLLGKEIQNRAAEQTSSDVKAYATEQLESATATSELMEPVSFSDAIDEFRNERQIEAHPIGLEELEKAMSGGLHFGGTVLIGGDAKAGKTVLVLDMLRAAMKFSTPCYVVSRDQLYRHIAGRMWAAEARVPRDCIRASQPAIDVLDGMRGWPLWFHRGAFDIDTICNAIKMEVARRRVRLWAVDFLQRITIDQGRQEKQESAFVRIADRLSDLAQDTNTCGMVISRVNKPAQGMSTQHRFAGEAGVQNACDGMLFVHPMKDANDSLADSLEGKSLRTIEVLPGRHWGAGSVAVLLDGERDHYEDFSDWTLGQKDAWLSFKRSKK